MSEPANACAACWRVMLEANRFAIDSIGVTLVQLDELALGLLLGLLGTARLLIWSRWQIGTNLRNAD